MFDGKVEKTLSKGKVPWEDLKFESSFEIQNNAIYYDPQDRLGSLPSPISDLSSHFGSLSAAKDRHRRLSIMETIFNEHRKFIVINSLLPELDFTRIDLCNMPLHDNEFDIARNILNNPNWRSKQEAIKEKTLKLGFEPEASRWARWWGIA